MNKYVYVNTILYVLDPLHGYSWLFELIQELLPSAFCIV